jgi:murein DD-endopeptidase MepM/ murein hydrolase activator NlpD
MARGQTWRVIGSTVLLTSLVWIALLAFLLVRAGPAGVPALGGPPLSVPLAARPAPPVPGPDRAIPPATALPPGLAGLELLVPVLGITADRLVDTFGDVRAAGARQHEAIDIMAAAGTPVVAAAAGQVERLFLSRDGGSTVYVRSPDRRLLFYYAHLAGYAPGLAEGRAIRAGDPLGLVGATGNADPAAPHLHFAVFVTRPEAGWGEPAAALNPFPLFQGRR